jgi:hypothetical protein
MKQDSLYHDQAFRKIVVASTSLGVSFMLVSLGSLSISKSSGLQFTWHWPIILLVVAGILWNRRFWRVIWQDTSERGKVEPLVHLSGMLLLGVLAFIYPVRFVEQSYRTEILRGLLTAAAFLGTMIWLIYRLGRGFFQNEEAKTETSETSS